MITHEKILYRESLAVRRLPFNIKDTDLHLFQHEVTRSIPATHLGSLRKCNISSKNVIFRGLQVAPESFPHPSHVELWNSPKAKLKLFISKINSIRKRKITEAFIVTDTWSEGYFHWMTDALPRLLTIKELLRQSTLLLPAHYRSKEYVRSSLSAFNIGRIEYFTGSIRCDRMRMATHTAPTGMYNEQIINGLRQLLTSHFVEPEARKKDRKIYISRALAGKRKIKNEEECIELLRSYEFEIIHFENHTLAEQAQIAFEARYLISNHGAGLTNILFMSPDSSVLELRESEDDHNNCYFALASALDITYYYQLCNSDQPYEDAHLANISVCLSELKNSIELILTSN